MTVFKNLFILLCIFKCVPVLTYPVLQSFNDERNDSAIKDRSAKKIAFSLVPGVFPSSKVGDVFQKSSKELQHMPPHREESVLPLSLPDTKGQKINPTIINLDLLEQKSWTSTNNQIIFKDKLTTQEPEESLIYFTNELDDLRSSTTKPNVHQIQETAKPPVKLLQKLLREYLPVANPKVKKSKPAVKYPVISPFGPKKPKPAVSMKGSPSGEGQFFSLLNTLNVILNRNRLPPSKTYKPSKVTPSANKFFLKPLVFNPISTPDNLTKTSYSGQPDESTMKYTKIPPYVELGLINDSATTKGQQISTMPPNKFETSSISSTFLDFETSLSPTESKATSVSTEVNDEDNFQANEKISGPYVPTTTFNFGSSLSFEDEKSSSNIPPYKVNAIKDSENGGAIGFYQYGNQLVTSSTAEIEGTTKHTGADSFFENSSLMNSLADTDKESSTSDFVTEELTTTTLHDYVYIHTYEGAHTMSQFENSSNHEDTVYPTQQPESTIVQENVFNPTQQPVKVSLFETTLNTINLLEHESSTKTDSTAFESTHSDDNTILETFSTESDYSPDDQNISDESLYSSITIVYPTHTQVFKEIADFTTMSLKHTFDFESTTPLIRRTKLPVVYEQSYTDKIVFETSTLVNELTVGTTDGVITVTTESTECPVIYEQDYSDEIVFETSTSSNELTVGSTESTEYAVIYEQDYSDEIIFDIFTRLNDLTNDSQSTTDGVATIITDSTTSFESEITHFLEDTSSVDEGTLLTTQLPRPSTTHDSSTELIRHSEESLVFETPFDDNFTAKESTPSSHNETKDPLRTIVTTEADKMHYIEETTDGTQQPEYNLIFEGASDNIHSCTDMENQEPTTNIREGPMRITDTTIRFAQTVVDESWIHAGAFDSTESQDLVGAHISRSMAGTAGFEGSTFLNENLIVSNKPTEDYNQNEDAVTTSAVSGTSDSLTEGFSTWTDLETKNDESSTDTQLYKTTSESYFDTLHNLLQSSTDCSTLFSLLGSTDHVTEEESLGLFLGNEPTGETTGKESTTLFTTLSDTSATDFMVTQTTKTFHFTDNEEEEIEDPFDCVTQSSLGMSTSTKLVMTSQPSMEFRPGSGEISDVTADSILPTLSNLGKITAEEYLVQDKNSVPEVFNTLGKFSTKSIDSLTTKSPQTEETSDLNEVLTRPGIPKDYFVQKWNLSMKNYTHYSGKPRIIQASKSLPAFSKNRAEKFLNLLSGELFIEGADSEENNEGEDDAYEVDESGMKIVKSGQRRGKWIENMSNDELMALIESVKLKHMRRS